MTSSPSSLATVAHPTLQSQEIGASPNKRDGSTVYTLPVLSGPNTGALITDSWAIAVYLDETYPEKPAFPKGSRGLIRSFDSAVGALLRASLEFSLLRSSQILNERSKKFFINAREAFLGEKVDKWSPEGPKRNAHWEALEQKYYGSAKIWYEEIEGKWVMGDTFSYADIIIAANSFWFKKVCRDDEWKRIASLHDGRWNKLLAEVEKECNLV
ncbi:hypothetical protein JVT61DRAFT_5069 [Boletus reticuloceps]|uniref:Glutathione S-transferase UstS-like C-terminal domain-containing protein n=1 Tax=Boletus reticuloceps TaxID=495285 RepID=A0A8I2Z1U1_9AGAM|nr:hypothetical protein JVT61DRAFT_5069 [Boletus reticuloceps]